MNSISQSSVAIYIVHIGYTVKMQENFYFKSLFLNIITKYFIFLFFFYSNRQYKVFIGLFIVCLPHT